MRAVVVAPGPDFSVQDVYRGWCKGLAQAGVEVFPFNLNDRLNVWTRAKMDDVFLFDTDAALAVTIEALQGQLWSVQPHVVVVISGFFTEPLLLDAMRARGHRVVLVHTESPYEDGRQLDLAPHADLNVLNDPTNIESFGQIAPSIYIPHAYDPEVHHTRGRTDQWDFSFVGTGYGSRIDWFEQVAWPDPDRVCLAGNWEALDDNSPLRTMVRNEIGTCVDNTDTADIYRASIIGLNRYRREAERSDLIEGWAMGPREVELAACGVFFGRDPRPESDEVFPMLPVVTDPGELSSLLTWAKAHPDRRQCAADKARAAIADRTFVNNAKQLLALLDV